MDAILTELSTPALIHAIKANLLEFFRHLSHAQQTEFYIGDKFMRWHTRIPHPWFNGVLALEAPGDDSETIIAEEIAYFRAHEVLLFTWWLDPRLNVDEWAAKLLPQRFRSDHATPGMAMELRALPETVRAPEMLQIVPVEDAKRLKQWTHTFILGYELPLAWEADFYELMRDLGLEHPLHNYLGYLHGEPVATSNLFLAAGVAGIQCVATIPKARGRGVGAALTLAPLLEARHLGYQAGVLQSSDMGLNIYRRLGFQQLCAMEHFYRSTGNDFD